MLRKQLECFLDIHKTLLELTTLVEQVPYVVHWLKQVICKASRLLKVALCLFYVSFSELQDSEVVE